MSEDRFSELRQLAWTERFADPGTGEWRDHWFVDGLRADIRNTPDGMVFSSGPVARDNGSHAVLWTHDSFEGDIRIEFDFTRLDTITRFVNILYIQATGKREGPYTEDIAEWSHLRQVPYMNCYFDNMELLHISYAAFGNQNDDDEDYVRARRYPTRPGRAFNQTDLTPDYFLTGLFRPGVTYHFTAIKTNDYLFLEVKNEEVRTLFHWPLAERLEPLTHGRVGIRHMFTRCSRYADIRIYTRD
jgi:hypothetical protein